MNSRFILKCWRSSLLVLLSLLYSLVFAQSNSTYQVALLDFNVISVGDVSADANLGQVMAIVLERTLVNSRRFVVVERANLQKLIDELSLSEQGFISSEEAMKFGEFTSVPIVIYGDILVYADDAFDITAKFVEVSSSQVSEAPSLSATNVQEFSDIAKQFVDIAKERFPLSGQVVEIEENGVYIRLGINNGMTEQDKTGVILRPREIAGSTVYDQIGTFSVKDRYQELSLIIPELNEGAELQVGDVARIQPSASSVANEPPAPETGSLVITGEPLGAEVYLDDELVGALGADGLETVLPVGEVRVEVRAENYRSLERLVTIAANDGVPLSVMLEPLSGSLTVSTGELEAEVFLDDEFKGRTPLTLPDVSVGEHRLRLRAQNHQDSEKTISVAADQSQAIDEVLTPLPAQVTLTITEPSYEVFVNGKSQGQVSKLSLAPGVYDLDVTAPDKEPQQFSLELSPGQSLTQDVALQDVAQPEASEATAETAKSSETTAGTADTETTDADGDDSASLPTNDGAASNIEASEVPDTQGILVVTSNMPSARVSLIPLLGGEEQTITLSEGAAQQSVPQGYYEVFATAEGAKAYRGDVDVVSGAQVDLDLLFEKIELNADFYLGTVSNGESVDLLWVGQAANPDAIESLSIQGPEGWNNGEPLTIQVEETSLLDWGAEVIAGDYVLIINTEAGELSETFTLGTQANMTKVTSLAVNVNTPGRVKVNWRSPAGAVYYHLELKQGNSLVARQVSEESSVSFESLNLKRGENYQICVTALNWKPGAEAPDAQASASRTCETFQTSRENSRSSSGSGSPNPGSGPNPPPPPPPPPPSP